MLNLLRLIPAVLRNRPQNANKPPTRRLLESRLRQMDWMGMEPLEPRVLMSATVTDTNDQTSEAVVMTVSTSGKSTSGTIDIGTDVDMFSFNVAAGKRISFNENKSGKTSLNSMLRLFNAQGQQLAINDDGAAPGEALARDSYLEYTFANAGTYYVGLGASGNNSYDAVTGLGDIAGATTGGYTLTLKDITPVPPRRPRPTTPATPSPPPVTSARRPAP
jgi:hypothetical protein